MDKKRITVMVVDDSALIRSALKKIISEDADLEVIGAFSDPFLAANALKTQLPSVMILDVEMPGMDGLTFLNKIMTQRPIPIIICSSLVSEGSDTLAKALSFGAVEVIQKPKIGTQKFFEESKIRITDAIKAASQAKLSNLKYIRKSSERFVPPPRLSADAVLPVSSHILKETTEKIIAVGASTGGTEALRIFIEQLPIDVPGVVVVQHMPEKFTRSFADRLNELSAVTVKEAESNDTVLRGQVLIAPGNKHTILKRSGHRYYVDVIDGDLVNRHRPSVDVLFRSVANSAGKNAVGVIMTGMGDDGARGLLEMKKNGAYTIAQDEESCVVYGMPKEAVKMGAVDKILPLENIANEVLKKTAA
ncbi:MAG: Chemotaxis response regulator protein-glutamate methylesterase of group 3 operon [Turneriella sp.]|nr:Chemotaxis response regulator protein-glutamate methylesterase of group 3 operon [Turneriella sp.]